MSSFGKQALSFLLVMATLGWGPIPSARAEDPAHAAQATPEPPGEIEKTPEVRVLTRQEALIKRLGELKLSPDFIGRLITAIAQKPKMTPAEFNQVIDQIGQLLTASPGALSADQIKKLKQIYNEELGAPGITAPGREFLTAVKRLRDEVGAKPRPTPQASTTPPPGATGPGATGRLDAAQPFLPPSASKLPWNPNDPAQANQFLKAQLENFQQQLDRLREAKQGDEKSQKKKGILDQILQALGGKGDKKDDGDKGGDKDKGSPPRPDKDAHGETPANDKDRDRSDDKKDSSPAKNEKKKEQDPAIAAMIKALQNKDDNKSGGDSKNAKDDKKNDKDGEFKLPEPKVSKDDSGKEEKKEDSAMKALLDAANAKANPAQELQSSNIVVPRGSSRLNAMGQASAPQPIADPSSGGGGGGNGGGDDGGGGGGGGKKGGGGGGAAAGGGGGGGGGDPFGAVGREEPAYGGGGGYNFEKPIAMGTGTSGEAQGASEEDSVDGGPAETPVPKGQYAGGGQLILTVRAGKDRVWLLDQVGSFQKRFCGSDSPFPALSPLCYKHSHRKPSLTSALAQRASSVDAMAVPERAQAAPVLAQPSF